MFFTKEINKTALSSNDDKRMQPFDSIELCGYATTKDLVGKVEQIKFNNIKRYKKKKINVVKNDVIKVNIEVYIQSCPEIPDHEYAISIAGGSGFGKTNALLNLINHETDINEKV